MHKLRVNLTKGNKVTLRRWMCDVNAFGYEAKIEGSEKAGSRRESNPGHLWLEPPVFCH